VGDDRVPVAQDERVDAIVFEPQANRILVRERRLAARDIDGISGSPERWNEFLNASSRSAGNFISERPASTHESESYARAAGTRDDDDVLAFGSR
jgi:hypothetical protein